MTKTKPVDELLSIMARLRDKKNGCPWDLEQDFDSLTKYTLEETYELLDAVDSKDNDHIREELGDMLLQIVFYCQIASEQGLFNFDDVAQTLNDKLIRRHPHIFSDVKVSSADDVVTNWNKIKQSEKTQKKPQGPLSYDFGTKNLPALMRMSKIAKKAKAENMFWPNTTAIAHHIKEEIDEIETATSAEHREEEAGDMMVVATSLLFAHGIDAERALQKGMQKFLKRWQAVYDLAVADCKNPREMSREALDPYWQQVKRKLS